MNEKSSLGNIYIPTRLLKTKKADRGKIAIIEDEESSKTVREDGHEIMKDKSSMRKMKKKTML